MRDILKINSDLKKTEDIWQLNDAGLGSRPGVKNMVTENTIRVNGKIWIRIVGFDQNFPRVLGSRCPQCLSNFFMVFLGQKKKKNLVPNNLLNIYALTI